MVLLETRRRLTMFVALKMAAAGVAMLVAGGAAVAQENYPSRPIRWVVPYSPGGITDNAVRALTDKLSARLGQQVNVENRAGAGGNLGTQVVAQSAPDGYTLLLGFDGNFVIAPHLIEKLGFDPLRDFDAVTKLADANVMLVANPSVPASNVQELVALSKQKPGTLSFGSAGNGQTSHIIGELLKIETGLDMLHIPYKGGGPALIDVVGGQIPLAMTYIAGANQYIRQGRMKAIGISAVRRDPALPEVPTFKEQGVNIDATTWVGMLVPAKTPRPIIDRLQREVAIVLQDADVRTRYAALGLVPAGNAPDQFGEQIRADLARWRTVVKQAGVKAE